MHPWVWLNEPQHGTAVQALTGICSTIAAVAAAWFAYGAYCSTKAQAESSAEQARIARDEAAVAAAHYEEQKREAGALRQRQLQQERARALRLEAEEAVILPRWSVCTLHLAGNIPSGRQGSSAFEVRNEGSSAAVDVEVFAKETAYLSSKANVLKSGDFLRLWASQGEKLPVCVFLSFRSSFGSRWTLRFVEKNGLWKEEFVSVSRPYAVPDEDAI